MYINKNSLLLLSAIGIFYSCKQTGEAQTNTQSNSSVETQAPNTDYQPAFKEQTRAPRMKTETELQIDIIAKSIGKPWGITHLPDGRLLITDKNGFMQIFTTNGEFITKITGFPEVDSQGQGGLLDVTLDPDFKSNRMIYWSFSEPHENGNLTSVAKGKLAEDEKTVENVNIIFQATPAFNSPLHFGSRILFDKEGYLFVSTGERSDLETRPQAQDLSSGLGKIHHIDKDGNPAPGNKYTSEDLAMPYIYTYGHRNVQGLTFHPETDQLWAAEFGPKGGDEINIIENGKNYGWPIITYGLEYSGETIGEGITRKDGMEQPVYYWDPAISPSGITFYNGTVSEWKNNMFLGCLSGQHIIRLKIKDNKVIGEERLLENEGERFRDVHQGKEGELFAITDSGKIYRIKQK